MFKRYLGVAFALALASTPARAVEDGSPPGEVYSLTPAEDGKSFYLHRYGLLATEKVELGGFEAVAGRAANPSFPWYWPYRPDAFATLRGHGLVQDPSAPPVVAAPKLDSVEKREVEPARAQPAQPALKPKGPSVWKRIGESFEGLGTFVSSNLALILAFLSLPILGVIARSGWRKYRTWQASRVIEIVYCGVPASGKTALIDRLRLPKLSAEHFDEHIISRRVEERENEPIVVAGITFKPTAIDIPGSKPAWFLDRVLTPKKILNRRVLLLVLAPFEENTPRAADPGFLQRQSGYVEGLLGAVVNSAKVKRPNLVVAFMSKADLYTGEGPFKDEFAQITKLIDAQCKAGGVPCLKFQGSARTGDGTEGMMQSIVGRMTHQ